MHVTNGIIIQTRREIQPEVAATPIPKIQKRKSFNKIDQEILPYKPTKRQNPPNYLTIERNENVLNAYISKKIDLLWLFLRAQSYLTNVEQTIPGWTRFNYQVC